MEGRWTTDTHSPRTRTHTHTPRDGAKTAESQMELTAVGGEGQENDEARTGLRAGKLVVLASTYKT